jgi:hypothetical protein
MLQPQHASRRKWTEMNFCACLFYHDVSRMDSVFIGTKGKRWSCPCAFNRAPRHEGVLGEWMYSSTHFVLGTRWRWAFSFKPRPLYPQENSPWYPLDRRLGGPQSQSGRGGEEKNSLASAGTRTPDHPARSSALYHWATLQETVSFLILNRGSFNDAWNCRMIHNS